MDTKNAIVHMKLGRRMKDQLGRVWEFVMLAGIAYYQYYEHRAAGPLAGTKGIPFPAELLEREDDNSLAPFTFAEPTFNREVADKYIDAGFVVQNTSNGKQYRREKGVFQVLDGGSFRDYLGRLNTVTNLHANIIRFQLVQSVVETGRTESKAPVTHSFGAPSSFGDSVNFLGKSVMVAVDPSKPEKKNELTDFEALKLLMHGTSVYDRDGDEWAPTDLVSSYSQDDADGSLDEVDFNISFFLSGPYTRNAPPKKVEPKKTYTAEEAIMLVMRDGKRVTDEDGDDWYEEDGQLLCAYSSEYGVETFFTCGPFTIAG